MRCKSLTGDPAITKQACHIIRVSFVPEPEGCGSIHFGVLAQSIRDSQDRRGLGFFKIFSKLLRHAVALKCGPSMRGPSSLDIGAQAHLIHGDNERLHVCVLAEWQTLRLRACNANSCFSQLPREDPIAPIQT